MNLESIPPYSFLGYLKIPEDKNMPSSIVVPLYNISISKNIEDEILFDNYKIINSKTFYNNYSNFLYKENDDEDFLKKDIKPREVEIITRPNANYVIIKEIKINNLSSDDKKKLIKNEIYKIELLIIAIRLYKKVFFHINKIYFVSSNEFYFEETKISTPLYNISNDMVIKDNNDKIYSMYLNNEEINLSDIYEINKIYNLLNNIKNNKEKNKEIRVPLNYFNKYFTSYDIYEKIINLSIVWESTILSDKNKDLNKTFKERGNLLLRKDKKIFEVAYQIRSDIVHNGSIRKETYKNIIKLFKKENYKISDSETENIVNFIKDYLETITKDILNHFILKLENKSIKDIAKNIDQTEIIKNE